MRKIAIVILLIFVLSACSRQTYIVSPPGNTSGQWVGNATSNLDMSSYNISNVATLNAQRFVYDDMYPKFKNIVYNRGTALVYNQTYSTVYTCPSGKYCNLYYRTIAKWNLGGSTNTYQTYVNKSGTLYKYELATVALSGGTIAATTNQFTLDGSDSIVVIPGGAGVGNASIRVNIHTYDNTSEVKPYFIPNLQTGSNLLYNCTYTQCTILGNGYRPDGSAHITFPTVNSAGNGGIYIVPSSDASNPIQEQYKITAYTSFSTSLLTTIGFPNNLQYGELVYVNVSSGGNTGINAYFTVMER